MAALSVTSPDGTAWQVGIAWRPRFAPLVRRYGAWSGRKRRDSGDHWYDHLDVPDLWGGDDLVGLVLGVVAAIAFVLALWWLLIPLALLVLDGLAVAVLVVLGVVARVLLGRPWTVRAVSAGGDQRLCHVRGLGRARAARAELAERLRRGEQVPAEL